METEIPFVLQISNKPAAKRCPEQKIWMISVWVGSDGFCGAIEAFAVRGGATLMPMTSFALRAGSGMQCGLQ